MTSVATSVDLPEVEMFKNHNQASIKPFNASTRSNEATTLAMSTQRQLFVDSGIKQETFVSKDTNLITRFEIICRFCLAEKERLLDIHGWNGYIVGMTASLADIKIELHDMMPKQICPNCFELLNQCITFKQQIVSSDTTLRRCIYKFKQVEIVNQKEDGETSDSEIPEQLNFDVGTTHNELIDGHKVEELSEEEYMSDYEIVSESDSNLYSEDDELADKSEMDAIPPEVKIEPMTNPNHVSESSTNVERSSRASVKFEQCDKEFSCDPLLQGHVKSHVTEKLKHQCSLCNKSYSRQTALKRHMSLHELPISNVEWQANAIESTKCKTSFVGEPDLHIHESIHSEDDNIQSCQSVKDVPDLTMLRNHEPQNCEDKMIKSQQCDSGFKQIDSLTQDCQVDMKVSNDRKDMPKVCSKTSLHPQKLSMHNLKGMAEKQDIQKHGKVKLSRFCCTLCEKSFMYQCELTSHMRLHTGEKPYACNVCSKPFRLKSNLRHHLRVHTGEKPYKCSQCSRSFGQPSTLAAHLNTHTGIKSFKCPTCSKSFSTSTTLAVHIRTHTGERPYKCPHCPKAFNASTPLGNHVRTHTGEKPYKCTHCSKAFKTSSALAIHVRTHTGEKPYKCPHCLKTFSKSWNMASHIRLHTGERPYKCPHCPNAYNHPSRLVSHIRSHTGEKHYKCPQCSKMFGTSSNLAIHIRSHTGEKPHKCTHCSKSFSTTSILLMHVRTHTGEKPYKCPQCSCSFARPASLAVHVRKHTGEKPHKCSHCPKSFGNSSTLSIHIRRHTGEKPYKCRDCSMAFVTFSAMDKHARTHTNGKPYKCSHCIKTFNKPKYLARHIRIHNREKPHKCPHCSRAFRSFSSLNNHVCTRPDGKFICEVTPPKIDN